MDQDSCLTKKMVISAIVIVAVITLIYVSLRDEHFSSPNYEGKFIKCVATQKIFLVQNGQKRYVSWPAYLKYGEPEPIEVSCRIVSPMPSGPDLA